MIHIICGLNRVKNCVYQGGDAGQLVPIDILLEDPEEDAEPASLDIATGQLNPRNLGSRTRNVNISPRHVGVRSGAGTGAGQVIDNVGEFRPCAVCGEHGSYGRSTVQDHQTSGDQPFLALVSRQIQVQPPRMTSSTKFAPLRGRKVLVFSDSRQTAARLAPSLQTQSAKDAIRPLIIAGYQQLHELSAVSSLLSLEDLPLAVYLAANQLGVRLRPEVHAGESFDIETRVEQAIEQNALSDAQQTLQLILSIRSSNPPESLLHLLLGCITDRFYGLESLALATVVERQQHETWPRLMQLPDLAGIAVTQDQKASLIRAWLQAWARKSSIWLSRMPTSWWGTNINGHSGKFEPFTRLLGTSRKAFEREWLPTLLSAFCEPTSSSQYRLRGTEVTLQVGGDWAYCSACRTTQRPLPGSTICSSCGKDKVTPIDPDTDPVFVARKGYYRASACDVLSSTPIPPFSLIAAEHTAQLNTAQADKVFSTAEENELLFQDVDLGASDGPPQYAVDVLSCTTTMEVGIDIGALSGVSLRNMPPGRANYQQRAGRAGRRGESIATVISFASSETHDEHFFSHPREMIRGEVDTPSLVLDNEEIAIRHVVAYLLQRYCQYRLPDIEPERMPGLFSVLGTVPEFIEGSSILNRNDFAAWLTINKRLLAGEIDNWLPTELSPSVRNRIITTFPDIALPAIDTAIGYEKVAVASQDDSSEEQPGEVTDVNDSAPPLEVNLAESGDIETAGNTTERLLDRLLYMGVLPRYAFPTDVATFHVFDRDRSTKYRPSFLYTPSQGLAVALTQYAPGKNLWIGNKLWTSGAIYSPMKGDIGRAWRSKRLYYECSVCHYAFTQSVEEGERHEKLDCVACGGNNTLGESKYWMRPVGFAHPITVPEGTSPGDEVPKSYATRAKLFAPSPAEEDGWVTLNEHLRVTHMREHLLVTNCGPKDEGYTFCTACGLIEPNAIPDGIVSSTHKKPFPPGDDCPGRASRGIVLGTDFVTDIMLVSLRVKHPISLMPGLTATESALRTLCEALRIAASRCLELDFGELQAEFRPALTPGGKEGIEAEIYIYDTLPGGAGFARRAKELGISLFQDALHILESCAGRCDRSCYRCLRSFGNKFEHDQLDRHLGASLVRYLLGGGLSFEQSRSEGSADILFEDLQRQANAGLSFQRKVMIPIPGIGTIQAPIMAYVGEDALAIIGVSHPLAPSVPLHASLIDVMEYSTVLPVYPKDEMLIRRNLPGATTDILEHLLVIDRH